MASSGAAYLGANQPPRGLHQEIGLMDFVRFNDARITALGERACLVRFTHGREEWIPDSAIGEDSEIHRENTGAAGSIDIASWLVVKLSGPARVDMPPKGNRGTVMQTISARKARQAGKART